MYICKYCDSSAVYKVLKIKIPVNVSLKKQRFIVEDYATSLAPIEEDEPYFFEYQCEECCGETSIVKVLKED